MKGTADTEEDARTNVALFGLGLALIAIGGMLLAAGAGLLGGPLRLIGAYGLIRSLVYFAMTGRRT